MIVSDKHYNKLLSNNKKLNKKVEELENQIKYLRLKNNEYCKEAVYWRYKYNKMRELYDNRETESPIIKQRDVEIEALKHMLDRLETRQEGNKLQTRALNKQNNELIEQLSNYQRKLNFLRDMFETKLEIAELYHDESDVLMWQTFLKEVE